MDDFGVVIDEVKFAAIIQSLVGDEELQDQINAEDDIEHAVGNEPGIFQGHGPESGLQEGRLEGRQDRRISERQGSDHVPVHKEPGLARDEHVPRT